MAGVRILKKQLKLNTSGDQFDPQSAGESKFLSISIRHKAIGREHAQQRKHF
jgi:hypothetical protein